MIIETMPARVGYSNNYSYFLTTISQRIQTTTETHKTSTHTRIEEKN